MELFQLRYFLEVAKQQHVRRSAEALHVSQPAVTSAIHKLEAELGVPLFVQDGRSIRLSSYGKFLYEELLPLSGTIGSLPERVRNFQAQERTTIRLNVFAAWFIVMEAVVEFMRLDSDLSVQLIQQEHMELADITISTVHHYHARKKQGEGLYVCTEPIYLAVPDIPRFRTGTGISLRDVEGLGFVQLAESKYFRKICDGFCSQAGLYPHTVLETDDPATVRKQICYNMGIGFWPAFSWGTHHTDKILLKRIEKPECTRDIIIERHDVSGDNVHVQVFYDFLTRYIEFYRRQHCTGEGAVRYRGLQPNYSD